MSRDMATMRRTSTNKQHSGPTGSSTSYISANDYASNSSRRQRDSSSTHRSLQRDELQAYLNIQNAAFGSAQDYNFNQYDSAHESERGGFVGYQEAQMSSSVFGSQGANLSARDRRRRMSLGSQMELLQSQIEAKVQPRPKSFITTSATSTGRDSLVIRTAPSSRSNSVPKVRTVEENEITCPPGSARALHFNRVSESMPNFKPSEVKPDFYIDSQEITYRPSTAQSLFDSNCRPTVRPVSKSESHTPIPQSPRGKQSTPTKYLSARAVAERLAKAIRGGSKSSKNKVDRKLAMAADTQDAPGILSDDSSGGKCIDQWPESYSRQLVQEQALDHSDIYADFNEKSQISSFREKRVETSPREEKEIDMLKSWLDGMKQQGEGVYDDLEKKAKTTCERLEMLDEEQAVLDDRLLCLNDFQFSDKTQSNDSLAAVQQRLRKMHEEKKLLALEAASELRRRISERSAARKVFTLMKREMDAYAKVMDKEKAELQSKLEEEIARRESSWMVKLDKIRSEERELRERVMNLQEENSYIQREISTLSSRDGSTKGKIKELESQVDSYRTRAEQAEAELDALHQAYGEKESEARNLRKIVERLPELCSDYEKRVSSHLQQNYQDGRVEDLSVKGRMPSKLQRDLSRLSILELALQSEMKVLKGGPSSHGNLEDKQSSNNYGHKGVDELQTELDRLQNLTGELQDENNLLSVKLRLAVREKEELRKALREAEEEIHELREKGMCQGHGEENHRQDSSDTSPVDRALDLDGDSNSQGSRKPAGHHTRGEATSQLQVRESQILNMKHEFGKQEDVIRGLEHSLSVAGKTVEAQKVRIMRLSARNEELVRLYHSKENEVQDLRILNSAEAESRRVSEQELNQLREQAVKCKQELRAQDLNGRILKEKLGIKEAELEQRNDEVIALEHRRDWLESEVQKLQRLLSEANQSVSSLEHQCEDHLDRIKNLEGNVEDHVKELMKLKEELPRVLKERDDLSHEADQMGREALRLGAEVEVLRRKVHELDEDVMVRDGQLSILCNALEDRE